MEMSLSSMTTEELADLVDGDDPVVVIVPVGSIEPHGPHLPLSTDTIISEELSRRATAALRNRGFAALLAPAIPFGVTECARAFKGAVSVGPEALAGYLRAVVKGLLANAVDHVCLVNNHLEPEHDAAVRGSIAGLDERAVSVACPLARRWARTLSEEFKRGACHAGQYETSIVMASEPDLVRNDLRAGLPDVPVSLSEQLGRGVSDFVDMGLSRSYAGSPSNATAKEGAELLDRLVDMVVCEVVDAWGDPRTTRND